MHLSRCKVSGIEGHIFSVTRGLARDKGRRMTHFWNMMLRDGEATSGIIGASEKQGKGDDAFWVCGFRGNVWQKRCILLTKQATMRSDDAFAEFQVGEMGKCKLGFL
jgi:hypothetical protein